MAELKIRRAGGDLTVYTVSTDSRMIDYRIKEDLTVEVQLPSGVEWPLVEKYIRNHENEIILAYERARQDKTGALPPRWKLEEGRVIYNSGVVLPFLGQLDLTLRVKRHLSSKGTRVYQEKLQDGKKYLVIETDNPSQSFLRYCIVSYYRRCALILCKRRLKALAAPLHINYGEVKISRHISETAGTLFGFALPGKKQPAQKKTTIWGSSHKKQLKFDWKIVMLPQEMIDYILLRELLHLKGRFYPGRLSGRAAKILPSYQEAGKWLAYHGKEYDIF